MYKLIRNNSQNCGKSTRVPWEDMQQKFDALSHRPSVEEFYLPCFEYLPITTTKSELSEHNSRNTQTHTNLDVTYGGTTFNQVTNNIWTIMRLVQRSTTFCKISPILIVRHCVMKRSPSVGICDIGIDLTLSNEKTDKLQITFPRSNMQRCLKCSKRKC
jgi:hypothetical protein